MAEPSDDNISSERVSKRATGPSRSQRRREALDVLQLADALMDAPEGLVAQLALDDELSALVADSRRIRQQIARKRQTQFLAKQLRKLDDDTLATLRAGLEHDREQTRRETAELHRLETWRERLIAEGDDALAQWLERHPGSDRTHLRQLIRQAQRERRDDVPPHASRELFRALRDASAPDRSDTE